MIKSLQNQFKLSSLHSSITNNAAGRGRKRGNMITTAQVNFMIQSAMIIQNVSKLKATETVNKYITEKGWKIV